MKPTANPNQKLNLCRRCRVSPIKETKALDGVLQTHIYCPQCQSGFWCPPAAKISAAERWNTCNPKGASKPIVRTMHCPDYNRPPVGCTSDDFAYGKQGGFYYGKDDPEYYS